MEAFFLNNITFLIFLIYKDVPTQIHTERQATIRIYTDMVLHIHDFRSKYRYTHHIDREIRNQFDTIAIDIETKLINTHEMNCGVKFYSGLFLPFRVHLDIYACSSYS